MDTGSVAALAYEDFGPAALETSSSTRITVALKTTGPLRTTICPCASDLWRSLCVPRSAKFMLSDSRRFVFGKRSEGRQVAAVYAVWLRQPVASPLLKRAATEARVKALPTA